MENLTHTLAGAVLARSGLDRVTPLALPALLVAANLPDVDIFGAVFGANYLDFHRGVSHSIVGVPALSLVWAAALWGYGRLRPGRDGPARFAALLGVVFLGVLSHPLLDFLNEYGVRPWLPFRSTRYYGDLIAVVDPAFWAILGAGLAAASWSLRAHWAALGAVLAVAIASRAGIWLAAGWCAAAAAVLLAGRALERRGRRAAQAALLLLLLYTAGVWLDRERVQAQVRAAAPGLVAEPLLAVDIMPHIVGRSTRWRAVLTTERRFYLADAGREDWRTYPPRLEPFEKNLDDPCYRAALEQPHMAAMARFARFPSADVRRQRDGCVVYLRDLRYARRSEPGFGVAAATVPAGDPTR